MNEIHYLKNVPTPANESAETDGGYYQVQEETHLRDYWKILQKRRGLVFAIFLVVVLAGAYFTFTATEVYTASALIKIEPITPTVTTVGELPRAAEGMDYYETQFALLKGRALARRVIAESGLATDRRFLGASVTSYNPIKRVMSGLLGTMNMFLAPIADFFSSKQEAPGALSEHPAGAGAEKPTSASGKKVDPRLVGFYQSLLEVTPIKNTRLVQVGFETPSPGLSEKLADAHAKGFIRMNLESRFQLTKEAREFLDAKNEELKSKLRRAEADLNRFRQTHGIVSIDKGENIVVERLVDINRQLTAARAQRLEAESLNSVVQGRSSQYLSQVLGQGMVPSLRQNLLTLEAEKIRQSTVMRPDHPRMIELDQQIKQLRQALNEEIGNAVRGIRETYVAARAKEEALENEAAKQQRAALAMKEVGVQYAVLQEEVNVNKNLYDTILRRLNETNVSNDIAVSNMQIVQSPERPLRPSAPNVPLLMVGYCVLGLMGGVGTAFFIAYMDNRLDSPDLVSRFVQLETVGVVPDANRLAGPAIGYRGLWPLKSLSSRFSAEKPQPGRSRSELILAHNPLSGYSEAYRNIRTNLLLSNHSAGCKVLLITSPSPGEGKTATTVNLGIASAQDGYRVLIVDGDMRRGSCHAALGMMNRLGLSDYLAGDLPLESVIQRTKVDGLSLLPCGSCSTNPSSLLATKKLAECVAQLRERFDLVFFDSPPAVAISDPAVLSKVSDGVLIVFHSKKTKAQVARQIKERFESIHAPVLGVILNAIDVKDPDYIYYQDYYGSRYGTQKIFTGSGNGNGATPAPGEPDLDYTVSRVAPKELFDRLLANLTNAIGPMAVLIVDECIAQLGESKSGFPLERMEDLCDRVSDEILDASRKAEFQKNMQNELRRL